LTFANASIQTQHEGIYANEEADGCQDEALRRKEERAEEVRRQVSVAPSI
jgi:hypothetical protein